jgi:hypothetical protein
MTFSCASNLAAAFDNLPISIKAEHTADANIEDVWISLLLPPR